MSRALILKYQIVTGMTVPPPEMLHQLLGSWSLGDREQFFEQCRQRQAQVAEALREAGLWSVMSAGERALILASPNQIDGQALRNVSWLMESAECLLWALGYVDQLPPYDAQADVEDVKRLPSEGIVALVRNATLRDADVISKARDVAELWHWRSRTRQLQESGRPVQLPKELTLVEVIRMAAEKTAFSNTRLREIFRRSVAPTRNLRRMSGPKLPRSRWSGTKH
jgi:hypothetical protein